MAEVIQFNCPACGTLLRLPLAMAGAKGPCPSCQKEIIAPSPAFGIGAFEIPVSSLPREIAPFQPFPESVPPANEEPPQKEVLVPTNPSRTRIFPLMVCCLLTAAVALALGFAAGVRSVSKPLPALKITESAPLPKVEPPPAVATALREPTPVPITPIVEAPPVEAPSAGKKPEVTPVSAAAEAALRAFLEAPDWASRSAHVLFPEKVRSAMETHSHEFPDGPTPFKSIAVKQTQVDEISGNTLFIFFVSTEAFPTGIPVAVQETASGWLVDWRAFVEFRDQLFQKFADGPGDRTGRFHLIVSPPPDERAANTENEHFVSFLLNAPLNQTPHLAFVKKASQTFATFQQATASGGFFTPVLEVAKRTAPDGKTYLEVIKVVATDWIPREE
jgi:hypothetical protein